MGCWEVAGWREGAAVWAVGREGATVGQSRSPRPPFLVFCKEEWFLNISTLTNSLPDFWAIWGPVLWLRPVVIFSLTPLRTIDLSDSKRPKHTLKYCDLSKAPWENGDGLEIWGSGYVILAKNQPNRLGNKQMGTSAWKASLTAFAGDLRAMHL